MRHTLNQSKIYLMKAIHNFAMKDIRLLEIPALQTIIQFKWDAYTKGFYMFSLRMILIMIFFFVIELNYEILK